MFSVSFQGYLDTKQMAGAFQLLDPSLNSDRPPRNVRGRASLGRTDHHRCRWRRIRLNLMADGHHQSEANSADERDND